MKQATRDWLHRLNLRFYEEQADAFSETRSRPWPGCARVLDALAAAHRERVRVLDIGCGNGRLLPALQARFGAALDYTGLDASARLLALAQARFPGAAARFVRADFLLEPAARVLPEGPFELVALFGVVHHVPGEDARRALLEAAAARVAPGGLLAFTSWRCDEDPRFARRSARGRALAGGLLHDHALEPGDHLLAFGEDGLRYCHRVTPSEAERLVAATGLEPVARFHADAAPGAGGNDYEVLRRHA